MTNQGECKNAKQQWERYAAAFIDELNRIAAQGY
jgi:hypothetical protein